MSKLSARIKGCSNTKHLRYQSFATMEEIDTHLSALEPSVQGAIKDMSPGQATGAIRGDKSQIFLVCA